MHALSTTLWKRLLAEASVRRRAPARLCVTWREGYASDGGTTRGVLHSRGAAWPPQLGTAAIQRACAVSGAVSGTDAASDGSAEVSRVGAASCATERRVGAASGAIERIAAPLVTSARIRQSNSSAALLATSAIKLLHAHLPTMPQLTRLIVSADFGQGKDKAHGARHGVHDGARDIAPTSPLRGFLQRKTTAAEPRPASELGVAGAVLGTHAASELGAVAAAATAAAAATDANADAHDADADGTALDMALVDGTLGQGLPRIWIVDEYDEYEEDEGEAEAEEADYDHFEPEGLTVWHSSVTSVTSVTEGLTDCLSEGGDEHVTGVADELVPRREGGDVTSEGRASSTADVVQHGAIEALRGMGAAGASSSSCCPICGHDLGSLDNAQLNRHVDDCLNLGHSHVSIGSQPGASSGKRRRAGMSPASGVSRSAEEQSAKRVASLNTWIVRSSRTCDMAARNLSLI